jgi:hypothetical protein
VLADDLGGSVGGDRAVLVEGVGFVGQYTLEACATVWACELEAHATFAVADVVEGVVYDGRGQAVGVGAGVALGVGDFAFGVVGVIKD